MILRRLLFQSYLAVISICLFLPLGLAARAARYLRDLPRRRSGSYFTDVTDATTLPSPYGGVRCYSIPGLGILLALAPCYLLRGSLPSSLFQLRSPPFRATPDQAAAAAVSQFVSHARTISGVAAQHDSRYICALQPHLMYANPATDDDRKFCAAMSDIDVWGFPLGDFISNYYGKMIQAMGRDDRLRREFLDLSRMFEHVPEQRFVDTVHLGELGQKECAEKLAEEIISRCRERKDAD